MEIRIYSLRFCQWLMFWTLLTINHHHVLNIPEVYCFYKPLPGFCARWLLKTWILSGTCKHCLWSDTNRFVKLSEFKWRRKKPSRSSVGGVRLTFVWVIELEDVGSGRVVWQHHHPSSNTHLLTGAGLVLWQTQDYSGSDSQQRKPNMFEPS